MSVEIKDFGSIKSLENAHLYTITNGGYSIEITDFGATLVSIFAPDREGKVENVVLGYESASEYELHEDHLGATVGRNANRIGGASVIINGKEYLLEANDNGCNNLHSGIDYYDKRIWQVKEFDADGNEITFLLNSADGDQGYPGNAKISVTYTLTDEHGVRISYEAKSDADTIFNMTNHSYFNLAGDGNGVVDNHKVWLDADAYTPVDDVLVPTGEVVDVTDTVMDFRTERAINGDYDHNWVLKNNKEFALVGTYFEPTSGRKMKIFTDLPGIQMYTGNFLNHTGRGGEYGKHSAVCFETQYFPDSVHHDNFASPILKAGETYHTVTEYRFDVE
jgi:aldose 1-epimerase